MMFLLGILIILLLLVGFGVLLGGGHRVPSGVEALAGRLKALGAKLQGRIRFSGNAEELALLEQALGELAELEREAGRARERATPGTEAALDEIRGVIAKAVAELRAMQGINKVARRARELTERPADPAERVAELARLEQALREDRSLRQSAQLAAAADELGKMLEQLRGAVSTDVAPGGPVTQESPTAEPLPSPANAEELEMATAQATHLLSDYGWALRPSQAAALSEALALAQRDPGTAVAQRQLNAAIEAAPEAVLGLSYLQRMLSVRMRLEGAGTLREEVRELESAYREGQAPSADALQALADRIQSLDRAPLALGMASGERALSEVASRPLAGPKRREIPGGEALTDRVHFSVSAPPSVVPGSAFIVEVWAHLERQRAEVERRIEEAGSGAIRLVSKGPVRLARGTEVTARLRIAELVVDDPEDVLLWEGQIGTASFPVRVPRAAGLGPKPALLTLHVAGAQVAKLHFTIAVAAVPEAATALEVKELRHRRAFASYASQDREEVLSVIQGMQKGVPDLDVFLDVASLRSGERWQDRLEQEIASRDVFYLFWSESASRSPWVEREWRAAYERRGVDFIDPVPLVSPELVPPPAELAELHFNDWVHAFRRRTGRERDGGTERGRHG